MKRKKINFSEKDLPLFCDFSCKFSDFSEADCVGACRREIAVWCKILNRYNNKHSKCLVRKTNKS